MGDYKTECPACGGSLSVVQLSWVGRMPLEEDGFSFVDADSGSATDDEVVKCDKCGKKFSLGDLMNV